MPYKDLEKQKEYNKERMRKSRSVQPNVCATQDVLPDYSQNVYFRPQPVVEKGTEEWKETRESLQWGIDTGRIRCRREVVEAYDLTPRYGPKLLTRDELLLDLNDQLKANKIDSQLFYLEDDASTPDVRYSYSKDWYK